MLICRKREKNQNLIKKILKMIKKVLKVRRGKNIKIDYNKVIIKKLIIFNRNNRFITKKIFLVLLIRMLKILLNNNLISIISKTKTRVKSLNWIKKIKKNEKIKIKNFKKKNWIMIFQLINLF